jgi:hypothetical protein
VCSAVCRVFSIGHTTKTHFVSHLVLEKQTKCIPICMSVGDSHKGPLITGEKPISSQNNKNTNELTNCKLHLTQSRPGDRSPRPWQPQRPIKQSAPAPLGRNSASLEGPGAVLPKLRLARGLDAPSGETPPRSRAGRPLGRHSASLEGYTHPRAGLCLARGLYAPSGGSPPRSRAMRALGWVSASLGVLAGPPSPRPLPWTGH